MADNREATDQQTGHDDPETLDEALEETVSGLEGADESELAKEAQAEAEETVAEQAAEQVEELRPNLAWNLERREFFDKISQLGQEGAEITPADVQKFVLDFYKEEQSRASRAVEEHRKVKEEVERYQGLVTDDLKHAWNMQGGMSPEQGMARLVAFEQWLYRDPRSAVMWLADQVRLDLSDVHDQPYVDPQVQQLQREFQRREAMDAQREMQARKQAEQQVMAQVEAFEQAKDDQGNLRHPYFREVFPAMLKLAKAEAVQDVEEAYRVACTLTPGVAERFQDDQRRAQAPAATAPAAKTVDKGSQRIPAKGAQDAAPGGKNPDNWEDAVNESFRELSQ